MVNTNRSAAAQQTYQVLYLPISAGPVKEMVAGFTFDLCLEKAVEIHSSVSRYSHNRKHTEFRAPRRHADGRGTIRFTPLTWMVPRR